MPLSAPFKFFFYSHRVFVLLHAHGPKFSAGPPHFFGLLYLEVRDFDDFPPGFLSLSASRPRSAANKTNNKKQKKLTRRRPPPAAAAEGGPPLVFRIVAVRERQQAKAPPPAVGGRAGPEEKRECRLGELEATIEQVTPTPSPPLRR